ncbi:DUF4043 domain-containing protein [Paraburkholderia phosphatilytica]|uniref:DUF4043 domain-containing protein n=1 Tax=Paraburkholderia phosphatilytica TaxID=2282883 RepID=UPI000E53C7DE|nr:DUF4043 domain-containing protein [Paraburkholderia phosphatilytica]
MPIQNFPAALQPAIQQGFLDREFEAGLQSVLGFRSIADREVFPNKVGETVTKTRHGMKAPTTTPLNPTSNTNLDNGLTPSTWTIEQYTLSINMYGDTIDLNTVTQGVGIASQFLVNAKVNGVQAAQSLDRLARNTLFASYLGGNTRVATTLGAASATVHVDDIRGFQYVYSDSGVIATPSNGTMVPVSPTYTMPVTIASDTYTLTGATADGSNVSTAPGGISGTLTFSSNVTVADGTVGNTVTSGYAPGVFRPNSRANTSLLVSGDTLTADCVQAGVAQLRSNGVPSVGGAYPTFISDNQMKGLFKDPEFQLLYRGRYESTPWRTGMVVELLGARFIPTTEALLQTLNGNTVQRAIMCGQGALIEGDYESTGYQETAGNNAEMAMVDAVCMVTREPLDRLQQIVAQSWYYIGGFCVPTDITATQLIIPTASTAYFKRAVILESL